MLTFGRSDLESMEMAESVRTAVTPSVTRSEVASLDKQYQDPSYVKLVK